ncbi:2-dehydropantoate 2-reductase [Corynebacterium lizhenjunii]|uniref:2-dehydropantoate 2-reductase n=1 Tax=Corynebacterium lizhenjunii TaxID=2709394 RepID=A0A7T0KDH0_9CORY|nr:2-dehydropantoate 2-reductase [Corynebacterium lizhenjunii]QPK78547.1 2-dehydropantoate 2-reductase [Corynebacterium lizhenjunii]
MKIVILGAGAVGGYYGGALQSAGHQVGFVARGATLEALHTRGLQLADATGTRTVAALATTSSPALVDLLGGVDVAIVATKALPGHPPFGDVDLLPSTTPVVITHNSVETHYAAAELLGAQRVLAGVIRAYLTRLGPAEIRLNPGPLSFNFGPLPGTEPSPHTLAAAEQLAQALRAGGVECDNYGSERDIMVDVWSKAMFVAVAGALGALANQPMGYLRTQLRFALRTMMTEVEAAAHSRGVALPANVVDATLEFCDTQYAEATSSMHRDIAAGLPNELDAQLGAIRRMSAVGTPTLDLVHALLRARGA